MNAIYEFATNNPDRLELVEIATFSKRDYRTYQRAYYKTFVEPHTGA
jgi:hypothetical protein